MKWESNIGEYKNYNMSVTYFISPLRYNENAPLFPISIFSFSLSRKIIKNR